MTYMTIRKILLRILAVIFITPVAVLLFIFINYHLISFFTKDQIYSNINEVPRHKYAMVFGTGDYEPEKWTNHGLLHRMDAVYKLYSKDKINIIIVSGKKDLRADEPGDMRQILAEMGVPDSHIIMDTTGIRTWQSVVNSGEYVSADSIIFISQRQHLERALFIANFLGINAEGYAARSVIRHHRFWTIREYLARVKCIFDCLKSIFTRN